MAEQQHQTRRPGRGSRRLCVSAASESTTRRTWSAGSPPRTKRPIEALRPGTALLVVLRGPNAGARFLLDDAEVSSGRHPNSDIFLDDVTVSRKHAVFYRDGDGYAVRDVGSLNGTYVNRASVDQAVLRSGDEVQIGKYRFVYYAA